MKVWFITGTSSGFGKAWTTAALERGDSVVATALNAADLAPMADAYGDRLLPLTLDVTDRPGVFEAVTAGVERFGRLDVVVNNAGFGYLGMIEEFTEEQARIQIETNFFGSLWVAQAAMSVLRAQGGGRILQVSSIGGVTAYPYFGLYNASKWAVEGMATALAAEARPHGVRVTILEPVGYATDFWGPGLRHTDITAAYAGHRRSIEAGWAAASAGRGDPADTAAVVLAVADHPDPPLRLLLGDSGLDRVTAEYQVRLKAWRSAAETFGAVGGQ